MDGGNKLVDDCTVGATETPFDGGVDGVGVSSFDVVPLHWICAGVGVDGCGGCTKGAAGGRGATVAEATGVDCVGWDCWVGCTKSVDGEFVDDSTPLVKGLISSFV